MQVEKEDDCLEASARKSARSQIRPEQRTIREFCFDQELWVKKALESLPPGLKTRMKLRRNNTRRDVWWCWHGPDSGWSLDTSRQLSHYT